MHTKGDNKDMKDFEWNEEKNNWLKSHRDISFEEIVFYIENDGLIDTYKHPDEEKYPRQSIFVVRTDTYVYIVPDVEEDNYFFLKTIIPDRKGGRWK